MKLAARCIPLLFLICFVCPAALADLDGDIRAVLSDKVLHKAETGITIARLGKSSRDVKIVYHKDAEQPLAPASNLKLVTTSAALDRLGADFKFRTLLVLHDGDVMIWGDGDPTFGDAELLRKAGWDVTTVFRSWADTLKKHKIAAVKNVVVDDSIFDTVFMHPNWPVDQEHKRYVAQVGGVNLNANCVDFYVRTTSPNALVQYTANPATNYISVRNGCITGTQNAIWLSRQPGGNNVILRGETNVSLDIPVSVTVQDPPMYAATVLEETLAAAGIKVTGTVGRDRTARAAFAKAPADEQKRWATLAIHETPLSTVLARANKDSMNLYAESLCKRLGAEVSRGPGSWDNGTAAAGEFLRRCGVDAKEFKLIDGSGLSRENAVSPNALLHVLIYDYYSKNSQAFFSSLSVAGHDGTLENRFRGSDLAGRVFAKSGFIEGVSSLSGYFKGRDNEWYAFSILMNGIPPKSNSGVKTLQENIIKAADATTSPKLAGGDR